LNSMGSALGGVDQSSSAFNECVSYRHMYGERICQGDIGDR